MRAERGRIVKIVFKWLQKHQTIIIFTVRIWFKVKDSVNQSRLLRNGPCSFAHPCIKEIRIPSLIAFSDFPSVLEKSHRQPFDQKCAALVSSCSHAVPKCQLYQDWRQQCSDVTASVVQIVTKSHLLKHLLLAPVGGGQRGHKVVKRGGRGGGAEGWNPHKLFRDKLSLKWRWQTGLTLTARNTRLPSGAVGGVRWWRKQTRTL